MAKTPDMVLPRCRTQKIFIPSRILVAALAASLLQACSSLQIDVDVYKGPLIQEPEIQLRQYLTLAISAKPLLDELYDMANSACTNSPQGETVRPPSGKLYKPLCKWAADVPLNDLYEILTLYEDNEEQSLFQFLSRTSQPDNSSAPQKTYGLKSLTKKVTDALALPDDSKENRDKKEKKVALTVSELNEALLYFAQKVLFTANSQDLYKTNSYRSRDPQNPREGSSPNDSELLSALTPILQSLGNTILVQANDLERQRVRTKGLKGPHADAEQHAVQNAFRLAPSVAFDQIKDLIKISLLSKAATSAPSVSVLDTSQVAARIRSETEARQAQATADKVLAVVQLVRQDVLAQADKANLTDPTSVQDLLKLKLSELTPSSATGKPSKEDIDLARATVADLSRLPFAPCSNSSTENNQSDTDRSCNGKNQIHTIDNLIATLRAKRVQALARGAAVEAANLQDAINAAYDQRTAMLYLRPASDYLRSVYTATAFQDASEPSHRNMLAAWRHYLNPFKKAKGDGKEQLEKQSWQTINKVTLGGGGATNYVLAKDDVGNWYVKAYSSDPEAIIKSATSLALYNAGKGFNTNLLRRYELQRQIDNPDTSEEKRKELGTQLTGINSQDGVPLLKVRDRYALRYKQDTERQAKSLYDMLVSLPTKVETEVDKKADAGQNACQFTEAKKSLVLLDTAYLNPAREKLQSLVVESTTKATDQPTEALEKAIQQGLTSIHLYAGQVFKTLAESKDADCDEIWRHKVAERAKVLPRAMLIAAATERKQSVERYEDALTNIADIAAEP